MAEIRLENKAAHSTLDFIIHAFYLQVTIAITVTWQIQLINVKAMLYILLFNSN